MRLTSEFRELVYDECGAVQFREWPCGCWHLECEAGHTHSVGLCSMQHSPEWLRDRGSQLSLIDDFWA